MKPIFVSNFPLSLIGALKLERFLELVCVMRLSLTSISPKRTDIQPLDAARFGVLISSPQTHRPYIRSYLA